MLGLRADDTDRIDDPRFGESDPKSPGNCGQYQHQLSERELRTNAGAWTYAERHVGEAGRLEQWA